MLTANFLHRNSDQFSDFALPSQRRKKWSVTFSCKFTSKTVIANHYSFEGISWRSMKTAFEWQILSASSTYQNTQLYPFWRKKAKIKSTQVCSSFKRRIQRIQAKKWPSLIDFELLFSYEMGWINLISIASNGTIWFRFRAISRNELSSKSGDLPCISFMIKHNVILRPLFW